MQCNTGNNKQDIGGSEQIPQRNLRKHKQWKKMEKAIQDSQEEKE